jgi:hypothetical protein
MPHTTCTSPDYVGTAAGTRVVIPLERPLDLQQQRQSSTTFSTKTYRRAVHGRLLGKR